MYTPIRMQVGFAELSSVRRRDLIRALKRQARRRSEMGVTSAAGGGGATQSDVTLVLVVVVFAFIVCQTPTFVDHIFWPVSSTRGPVFLFSMQFNSATCNEQYATRPSAVDNDVNRWKIITVRKSLPVWLYLVHVCVSRRLGTTSGRSLR